MKTKIQFAAGFTGDKVECQIGDQHFVFERAAQPFEVEEAVGAYCLRLPQFEPADAQAPAKQASAQVKETAPRKN